MVMNIIYIVAVGVVVVCVFILALNSFKLNKIPKDQKNYLTSLESQETEIGSKSFTLYIADTTEKRQRGLMHVKELAGNTGMLFKFDQTSIYPFWMKNTLIPLDIIWLNSDGKIVYIAENAQPCKSTIDALCEGIVPKGMAKYVIELNSGEAAKLGLNTGDMVDLSTE